MLYYSMSGPRAVFSKQKGSRFAMDKLKSLFQKYREIILYVFFGGLTTLVNIVCYWAVSRFTPLGMDASVVAAWFVSVLFAYLTNRTWVFESRAHGAKAVSWEVLAFFGGRAFSGLLDLGIMWLFVTRLGYPDMLIKIISNILVIILNYVISKLVVFRKKK